MTPTLRIFIAFSPECRAEHVIRAITIDDQRSETKTALRDHSRSAVFSLFGAHGLQGSQADFRSEEHTSELQSLMRIPYAVFCLKKKKQHIQTQIYTNTTTKHKKISIYKQSTYTTA